MSSRELAAPSEKCNFFRLRSAQTGMRFLQAPRPPARSTFSPGSPLVNSTRSRGSSPRCTPLTLRAAEEKTRHCSRNVHPLVLRIRSIALAQETSPRPCLGHVASPLPRKRPLVRAQETPQETHPRPCPGNVPSLVLRASRVKEIHDLFCSGERDGRTGPTVAALLGHFCPCKRSNLSSAQQPRIRVVSGVAAATLARAHSARARQGGAVYARREKACFSIIFVVFQCFF